MKTKNIDWNTYTAVGHEPPPRKTLVLVSYDSGTLHNFKAATSEGYFGTPNIDFPNTSLTKDNEEFFDRYGPCFYNAKGEPLIGAYAWAYKPACMLS